MADERETGLIGSTGLDAERSRDSKVSKEQDEIRGLGEAGASSEEQEIASQKLIFRDPTEYLQAQARLIHDQLVADLAPGLDTGPRQLIGLRDLVVAAESLRPLQYSRMVRPPDARATDHDDVAQTVVPRPHSSGSPHRSDTSIVGISVEARALADGLDLPLQIEVGTDPDLVRLAYLQTVRVARPLPAGLARPILTEILPVYLRYVAERNAKPDEIADLVSITYRSLHDSDKLLVQRLPGMIAGYLLTVDQRDADWAGSLGLLSQSIANNADQIAGIPLGVLWQKIVIYFQSIVSAAEVRAMLPSDDDATKIHSLLGELLNNFAAY